MKKTITIVGNGAIGLLLAYHLSRTGNKVRLAVRTRQSADLINREGILFTDLNGETHKIKKNITSANKTNEIPPSDISIMLTKAYSTENAIKQHIQHLKKSKTILTLQNGLGNVEIIQKLLPNQNILAGTITAGAESLAANHTSYRGKGKIFVAAVNAEQPTLDSVAEMFRNSDIPCDSSGNWQTVIWTKLYINAIVNPITAMYNVKNGEILKNKELRILAEQISDEILILAKKTGICINIQHPFDRILEVCKMTADNKSSMLQDMQNKKTIELDAITGEIIELAKQNNIPTPSNSEIYRKLKQINFSNNKKNIDYSQK